ncbi:MAG: hypothetical protein RIB59_09900 [Rhodospirillales bacterium]
MRESDHVEVARRALAALERFSFPEDAPVLIEGSFVIAYHVMNGLMHREGALREDQHINSPAHSPLGLDEIPDSVRPIWLAFEDLQALRVAYVWAPGTPGNDVRGRLEAHWRLFRGAANV